MSILIILRPKKQNDKRKSLIVLFTLRETAQKHSGTKVCFNMVLPTRTGAAHRLLIYKYYIDIKSSSQTEQITHSFTLNPVDCDIATL